MADIKEVARRAGVSISTVSRVMNGTKGVSDELAVKVERAILELGYSPNSMARGLKSVASKDVAVIVTSLSRSFFIPVLEGISSEAAKQGYVVQIMETHDSLEREMQLVDFSVSQWVDGIILASSAYGDDQRTQAYIDRLSQLEKRGQRIPVIGLEYVHRNPQVDSVVVDHRKAAFDAVRHLVRNVGKRSILHISLPRGHFMGAMRVDGYRDALADSGLPFSSELVVEGAYTTYSGYMVTKALLDQGLSFDAVFCANDQMAVGALKALEERGVEVPEQVAVMGYDDIFTASVVKPSLSSVMVPKFEMGAVAMRQLIKNLRTKPARREVKTLKTEIVERESTRRGAHQSLKDLNW